MNRITRFFHEIRNPHCEHCIDESKLSPVNEQIEFLKHELEVVRLEKNMLLEKLLNKDAPQEVNNGPVKIDIETINKQTLPWPVRRQMLEQKSREKAAALRNAAKPDTEDLELELGIKEDAAEPKVS